MNHRLDVPLLIPDARDCTACAERLRTNLGVVDGIVEVALDPVGRKLNLTYDPSVVPLSVVEARAKEAGLALQRRFRHVTLRLEGLDCPECAGAVEHGVTHIPGVLSASANFPAANLYVEYDAQTTDLNRVAEAVGRTGYRAVIPGTPSNVVVVRVAEMDCQDEVRAIEGRLRSLPGVASWHVNLLERTLRVQFDPTALRAGAILGAIRSLGMTVELTERAVQTVAWRKDPLFLSTTASGVFLGAALIVDWVGVPSVLDHTLPSRRSTTTVQATPSRSVSGGRGIRISQTSVPWRRTGRTGRDSSRLPLPGVRARETARGERPPSPISIRTRGSGPGCSSSDRAGISRRSAA